MRRGLTRCCLAKGGGVLPIKLPQLVIGIPLDAGGAPYCGVFNSGTYTEVRKTKGGGKTVY